MFQLLFVILLLFFSVSFASSPSRPQRYKYNSTNYSQKHFDSFNQTTATFLTDKLRIPNINDSSLTSLDDRKNGTNESENNFVTTTSTNFFGISSTTAAETTTKTFWQKIPFWLWVIIGIVVLCLIILVIVIICYRKCFRKLKLSKKSEEDDDAENGNHKNAGNKKENIYSILKKHFHIKKEVNDQAKPSISAIANQSSTFAAAPNSTMVSKALKEIHHFSLSRKGCFGNSGHLIVREMKNRFPYIQSDKYQLKVELFYCPTNEMSKELSKLSKISEEELKRYRVRFDADKKIDWIGKVTWEYLRRFEARRTDASFCFEIIHFEYIATDFSSLSKFSVPMLFVAALQPQFPEIYRREACMWLRRQASTTRKLNIPADQELIPFPINIVETPNVKNSKYFYGGPMKNKVAQTSRKSMNSSSKSKKSSHHGKSKNHGKKGKHSKKHSKHWFKRLFNF